jgi:TM2 domain-containing membrane protein YozV
MENKTQNTSGAKKWKTLLLISIFFGAIGADRFYVGKIKTGILKLLIFIAAISSFFGFWSLYIWWAIDIFFIVTGKFTDKYGNKIKKDGVVDAVENAVGVVEQTKSDVKVAENIPNSGENIFIKGKEIGLFTKIMEGALMPAYILNEFSLQDGIITVSCKNNKVVKFKLGDTRFAASKVVGPYGAPGHTDYAIKENGKKVITWRSYSGVLTDEEYEKIGAILSAQDKFFL